MKCHNIYHAACKFCGFHFLWIDLDQQKLVPTEKNPQNKTLQKLTPFSKIKNSTFNRLMPLGQYTLEDKNINMNLHWKNQLELSRVKQFITLNWHELVI